MVRSDSETSLDRMESCLRGLLLYWVPLSCVPVSEAVQLTGFSREAALLVRSVYSLGYASGHISYLPGPQSALVKWEQWKSFPHAIIMRVKLKNVKCQLIPAVNHLHMPVEVTLRCC